MTLLAFGGKWGPPRIPGVAAKMRSSNNSANAIWVIDNFKPAPTPQFVAWPNRGFIPHTLIPARWSLSYPGATFTSVSVTMTQGGSPVTTTIVSNETTNVGDNTIVWEPAGLPASVTNEVTYDITVSGITGAGVPASYSYSVTLFNPDLLGDSVTITGTNTPFTTGSGYTFKGTPGNGFRGRRLPQEKVILKSHECRQ